MKAAATVGALSVTGMSRADRMWSTGNDAGWDGTDGTFEGLRYDKERKAVLLIGEPGAYAMRGKYTSAPIAAEPARTYRIRWHPRWTGPLSWDRFEGNPILKGSPGAWDDTIVVTCSVVPLKDTLKMFYGARDRGIGLAVCDRKDLSRWTKRGGPLLQAGRPGTFDAGGVLSPTVVQVTDSHWYMYYVGFDPARLRGSVKVHQVGLAQSRDQGDTWSRVSTEPVIPLGPPGSFDGAIVSSNTVLKIGPRWYCWYTGISEVPYLASVCLATSQDGLHWQKYPHNPVLSYNPYVATDAFVVATPHVLHEDGVFRMWYNAKGFGEGREVGNYRICYAESLDGIHWERCPKLPVFGPSSGAGWDSQMVEYPDVVNLDGRHCMWYSGNDYNALGYAVGRAVTRAVVESRTGASRTPDADWSAWTTHELPSGSVLGEARGYLQIRISLETDDRAITPMVQQLAVEAI